MLYLFFTSPKLHWTKIAVAFNIVWVMLYVSC